MLVEGEFLKALRALLPGLAQQVELLHLRRDVVRQFLQPVEVRGFADVDSLAAPLLARGRRRLASNIPLYMSKNGSSSSMRLLAKIAS